MRRCDLREGLASFCRTRGGGYVGSCVMSGRDIRTEVQGLSFVGSTGGEDDGPRLWNLQNLGPIPP